ncbi:helix-turn-helix domain-containing protein, partial [Enterobacter roggenkampii]|nr:helix-turn-helix domain-containing protein [Enterobacter roggenkampii]
VTASRFILERAMIARSTVMSILSQLQRGGFITLEKGLLVAMRVLPEKF